MTVLHVVGARPNFMKAAPVYRALAKSGFNQVLVHTGQHYDALMSDVFFQTLEIPAPDESLNVGSGSHAQQTAAIMSKFEPVVLARKPDVVLVYGDVNSTVAAALVCAKLGIRVAHVEAGLRSFDREMPEEINRLVTDQLSDLLFTPSPDGDENLKREGVAAEKIFLVGNVMIDTLVQFLPRAEELFGGLKERLSLDRFGLVTLHRPSNVDDEAVFLPMLQVLDELSRDLPLIFPVHPRTRDRWSQQLKQCNPNLRTVEPLGYLEFLALQKHAAVVITDSGGIQEETTYLGTPCLTLRENTERPITITAGTNVLIGRDWKLLREEFARSLNGYRKQSGSIPLWDGHASDRIAEILSRYGNPSSR
ncbi:MAG TPA: UDP-N-acetylglucosamine 2-epimerase (non-hydrolyzing) [Acidobacteriaceae bacterium]|nr:UDP-N-acetylglucosamine 2-epimerase (non-hydrolyzing) [Acidobacteriaceae bacterium]